MFKCFFWYLLNLFNWIFWCPIHSVQFIWTLVFFALNHFIYFHLWVFLYLLIYFYLFGFVLYFELNKEKEFIILWFFLSRIRMSQLVNTDQLSKKKTNRQNKRTKKWRSFQNAKYHKYNGQTGYKRFQWKQKGKWNFLTKN